MTSAAHGSNHLIVQRLIRCEYSRCVGIQGSGTLTEVIGGSRIVHARRMSTILVPNVHQTLNGGTHTAPLSEACSTNWLSCRKSPCVGRGVPLPKVPCR